MMENKAITTRGARG